MNHHPVHPQPAGGPVIPPPPAQVRRRRQGGAGGGRWLIWSGALLLGMALGHGAYRWLQGVDFYVDYWVALLLG